MGISEVINSDSNSNSDFNMDLEDNNGLYCRRTRIDNKQDPKKGNFGDDKEVDMVCKLYS